MFLPDDEFLKAWGDEPCNFELPYIWCDFLEERGDARGPELRMWLNLWHNVQPMKYKGEFYHQIQKGLTDRLQKIFLFGCAARKFELQENWLVLLKAMAGSLHTLPRLANQSVYYTALAICAHKPLTVAFWAIPTGDRRWTQGWLEAVKSTIRAPIKFEKTYRPSFKKVEVVNEEW